MSARHHRTLTAKLDGCYVLRTDLSPQQASKQVVHERYKSLAQVEQAFRRAKTAELEMRPVNVRKETSSRGHLLVVMLAYLLTEELGRRWAELDLTVTEGLQRLNTYCATEVAGVFQVIPEPRQDVRELIEAARVTLPKMLPRPTSRVSGCVLSLYESIDTQARPSHPNPRKDLNVLEFLKSLLEDFLFQR